MDENKSNNMLVMTPSALLAFLTQIEELSDKDISISETDRSIEVKIGESIYTIESPEESVVEINQEAVDDIEDLNEEGYSEISELDNVDVVEDITGDEPVEGGIIKELIKTLAVGGLVRLTKSALQNS